MMSATSLAAFAPPLPLGAAFLLGMGCSAALWERLAARWRTVRGRMAAGAVAAVPLFVLLRLSVSSIRGGGAAGFLRAAVLGILLGALSGGYAATRDPRE
jgi:hypothetical protein